MKKRDMLKKIGFSEEYLEHLDRFKQDGICEVQVKKESFVADFSIQVRDTSELQVNDPVLCSFNHLKTK